MRLLVHQGLAIDYQNRGVGCLIHGLEKLAIIVKITDVHDANWQILQVILATEAKPALTKVSSNGKNDTTLPRTGYSMEQVTSSIWHS